MSKRPAENSGEAGDSKVKKEEAKSEEQSIEDELAALEQFFVVDEEEDNNEESSEEMVIKDEVGPAKSPADEDTVENRIGNGENDQKTAELKSEPAASEAKNSESEAKASVENTDEKSDAKEATPKAEIAKSGPEIANSGPEIAKSGPPGFDTKSGIPHGYAGFTDQAFQQKNFCLALADPNPVSGKVEQKSLPKEVLEEEQRRLADRDDSEVFLGNLPTNFVNASLWRLDPRRYLKGVYRIDRNNALLIFADKDECRLAFPGIQANYIDGIPLNVDRVGKSSMGMFRQRYPYDDVTTIPNEVNGLALCIQGVLHGATDILHKVNILFPKAVTIHYPMIKGRRGRPVFVYFQTHEDALEAFWSSKRKFLTKYPITTIFARIQPHCPTATWPEMEKFGNFGDRPDFAQNDNLERVENAEQQQNARPSRDEKFRRNERNPQSARSRDGNSSSDRNSTRRTSKDHSVDRSKAHHRKRDASPKHAPHAQKSGPCPDCVRLRNQRNMAEGQVAQMGRIQKELEDRIMHLDMENADLKKGAGKRDKESWLLRQSLDDSLKRVTNAEAECRELQKANDEMRDRLNFERDSWKKKLGELDFELRGMEEYKQKCDELERSHAKLRDYDWLDREYNRLKKENAAVAAENQRLFEQSGVLQKALAGHNMPYEAYLDANQRAVQYLASTAQQYSEEVQALRAERTKLLSGGRPERLERPVTSTALDDAARKVAELQVAVTRLEGQKVDAERKLELSQGLLNTIGSYVQTFDQCCVEIADMFAKCPLTIQSGSLETLSRPTSQNGAELATKARLLRGSLRDLLSYIKTLQGKLDSRRQGDPRLDHSFAKDRSKELSVLNDIIASKDARIAQLELQAVMTQMRR